VSDSITERVRQVVALTFNVPPETVGDQTSQDDIAAWDSIGHANLILGLEEEFGAALPDDVMPTLTSVAAIADHFRHAATAG
jgi:acyl carrier protein